MSKNQIFSLLLLFTCEATPAVASCYSETDHELARYCRGMSADEIIHLRDRRRPQIEARLGMIPGLVGNAAELLKASETEKAEKLEGHGFLRQMEPRRALPADRLALEFALAALQELKALRVSHPGSAEDIIRKPLSKESLEADFAPFARALFAAALDADVANNRVTGDLQFVEVTASRLHSSLSSEREQQREARHRLAALAEQSAITLKEAQGRYNAAAQRLEGLHTEREALRAEREGIPGKVKHLDWMHSTGCDQAHKKTVCPPAPRDNDETRCRGRGCWNNKVGSAR